MDEKWKALAENVIAVAQPRYGGKWKAYIGAVPGNSHKDEWRQVSELGHLLDEKIAAAIFPDFAAKYTYGA